MVEQDGDVAEPQHGEDLAGAFGGNVRRLREDARLTLERSAGAEPDRRRSGSVGGSAMRQRENASRSREPGAYGVRPGSVA